MFGSRPFDTDDESRNNPVIGLLALGEGWHNNHHAFPSMAYHGMTLRQVDLSGLLIRLLARLGLVWNVKAPSALAVERRRRAVTA
jgi:stearoyl-CoA desaturase (delta-9 desaturase)